MGESEGSETNIKRRTVKKKENKDEFNALMQKASDDMLKLAKAIDTADDLRVIQKDLMWSNCSACHNRFRAEH